MNYINYLLKIKTLNGGHHVKIKTEDNQDREEWLGFFKDKLVDIEARPSKEEVQELEISLNKKSNVRLFTKGY